MGSGLMKDARKRTVKKGPMMVVVSLTQKPDDKIHSVAIVVLPLLFGCSLHVDLLLPSQSPEETSVTVCLLDSRKEKQEQPW